MCVGGGGVPDLAYIVLALIRSRLVSDLFPSKATQTKCMSGNTVCQHTVMYSCKSWRSAELFPPTCWFLFLFILNG